MIPRELSLAKVIFRICHHQILPIFEHAWYMWYGCSKHVACPWMPVLNDWNLKHVPTPPSCTSTKTLQVTKQHRHLSTDAGYAGLPSCTRQRWQPAVVCYDSRIYASLGVFQEVNRKSSTTFRPLDVLTIRVACCIFHTTWEVCTSITIA